MHSWFWIWTGGTELSDFSNSFNSVQDTWIGKFGQVRELSSYTEQKNVNIICLLRLLFHHLWELLWTIFRPRRWLFFFNVIKKKKIFNWKTFFGTKMSENIFIVISFCGLKWRKCNFLWIQPWDGKQSGNYLNIQFSSLTIKS